MYFFFFFFSPFLLHVQMMSVLKISFAMPHILWLTVGFKILLTANHLIFSLLGIGYYVDGILLGDMGWESC